MVVYGAFYMFYTVLPVCFFYTVLSVCFIRCIIRFYTVHFIRFYTVHYKVIYGTLYVVYGSCLLYIYIFLYSWIYIFLHPCILILIFILFTYSVCKIWYGCFKVHSIPVMFIIFHCCFQGFIYIINGKCCCLIGGHSINKSSGKCACK